MDGGTVTEADATLVEKNLAITGISLPDTDLDIGDAVRPDVRIANTGTEDAALAFGAGVWLSVDPVFDLEEDRLLAYFVYDP